MARVSTRPSVFAELSEHVPDDAVMCVDVGNNTYSFGRYFEVVAQDVVMSGYLGSIGFSFPAAMGAWAAVGDTRKIVSVSGDGGFGQYAMEFTTAAKYGMNITHVLLNNSELGKISKEQRAGEYDVWQTSLHNPDFAAFAQLCGGHGIRVHGARPTARGGRRCARSRRSVDRGGHHRPTADVSDCRREQVTHDAGSLSAIMEVNAETASSSEG